MGEDQWRHGVRKRNGGDDFGADLGMDADLLEFLLGQRSRLRQDVFRDRQLPDVVQQRGRLDALDVGCRQTEGPRQSGGVQLHAPDVHLGQLVLRVDGAGEGFDRGQVQIRSLLHVALLVFDPPHVDLVGAVREVQRRERQRRQPVPRVVHERGGQRGGAGAHEVAGRAPQEVRVPRRGDPLTAREGDGRRHETGVEQEVRGGCRDEWTRERRHRARRQRVGQQPERQPGAFHRDHQRRDAEQRPMDRVLFLPIQLALAQGAPRRHEHGLMRAEEEERGEVDRVRHRQGRAARRERERDFQRGARRRQYERQTDQQQEDAGRNDRTDVQTRRRRECLHRRDQ